MSELTDKERIADLEQQLAAANQKVESFEQAQQRSTDRKLFVAEKITKHFLLGPKLKASLVKLMNGDTSKDNIADVLTAGLYRFTRIGIFALLVAIIPIGILTVQTILLSRQNDKIDRQNYRLDQQTALLEAERRSAVILESGNVLDAISRELADDRNYKDSLSSPLIGRTIALSRAFKPYKYLDPESDTIIGSAISPERGHLLVSLHESKLDSLTMAKILFGADFQKADLRQAKLFEAQLRKAQLRGAILDDAFLNNAYLMDANLYGASLRGAILQGTNFIQADLSQADFREANLQGADFRGANLQGADFRGASLFGANLRGADFREADFREAILQYADLRYADFREASLQGANLSYAIALKDSLHVFLQASADTTGMTWKQY